MRADVVVLPEPAFDDDLRLFGGREPFGVQNLAPRGPSSSHVTELAPIRAARLAVLSLPLQ